MRIRSLILVCSLVIAMLMIIGCAKMPQQEINQAKAAIEAARVAQADKYATADFNAAQDAYNAALTEIEKQKTASPFSRKYDNAKTALIAVVTMANNTVAKATDEKTKVLAQIDTALALAKASESQVKELLVAAAHSTLDSTKLNAFQQTLTAVDTDLVQAEALKNTGDVAVAFERITINSAKLDSLKIIVTTAIEKTAKPAKNKVAKPAAKKMQ